MASEASNTSVSGRSPYEWYRSVDKPQRKLEGSPTRLGVGKSTIIRHIDDGKSNEESRGSMDTDSVEDEWCPLFSTTLPRDFESHSGLAAIAALLEEEEATDGIAKQKVAAKRGGEVRPIAVPVEGGGKCARGKKSASLKSRQSPYAGTQGKKELRSRAQETTMGEAQLFLQMWKI